MNKSVQTIINLRTSILPFSHEILAIMQDPDKYGLEENFVTLRNPDALYTHIDADGSVVIDGIGEAKLGHLNERAINQLELFPTNMRYICDIINSKPEFKDPIYLRYLGLQYLYTLRWTLGPDAKIVKINPSFRQYLFVPANREITRHTNESDEAYYNRLFYELVTRKLHADRDIYKRFLNIAKNLYILKTAFSTEEVSIIADYYYNKLSSGHANTII